MNLYFRLLLTFLRNLRREPIEPLDTTTCTFRVMPWDLDLFGHMNNGRYLQIMDVARFAWMLRSRAVRLMVRHRWGALLGGTLIRYQRALKPFHAYRVHTRLVFWDSRWLYFEHRFERLNGQTVATGHARAALRKAGRWIDPKRPVAFVAPTLESPPAPPSVRAWMEADALLSPVVHRSSAKAAPGAEPSNPDLGSAWVPGS